MHHISDVPPHIGGLTLCDLHPDARPLIRSGSPRSLRSLSTLGHFLHHDLAPILNRVPAHQIHAHSNARKVASRRPLFHSPALRAPISTGTPPIYHPGSVSQTSEFQGPPLFRSSFAPTFRGYPPRMRGPDLPILGQKPMWAPAPPVPPSTKLGGTGGAPPTTPGLLRNQRRARAVSRPWTPDRARTPPPAPDTAPAGSGIGWD